MAAQVALKGFGRLAVPKKRAQIGQSKLTPAEGIARMAAMDTAHDDRVSVIAGATSVAVTLTVGQTQVSVRVPRTAGDTWWSEEQLRATALRSARRALEVAIDEIGLSNG